MRNDAITSTQGPLIVGAPGRRKEVDVIKVGRDGNLFYMHCITSPDLTVGEACEAMGRYVAAFGARACSLASVITKSNGRHLNLVGEIPMGGQPLEEISGSANLDEEINHVIHFAMELARDISMKCVEFEELNLPYETAAELGTLVNIADRFSGRHGTWNNSEVTHAIERLHLVARRGEILLAQFRKEARDEGDCS